MLKLNHPGARCLAHLFSTPVPTLVPFPRKRTKRRSIVSQTDRLRPGHGPHGPTISVCRRRAALGLARDHLTLPAEPSRAERVAWLSAALLAAKLPPLPGDKVSPVDAAVSADGSRLPRGFKLEAEPRRSWREGWDGDDTR